MSDNQREAIVAGHICLDVFPTLVGGSVQFKPGQTVEAGPVVFSTGGAVSHTGLALHKLGVSTGLSTPLVVTRPSEPMMYVIAPLSRYDFSTLDMGTKIVGLKIGDRGLYLRTANAEALENMGRCGVTDVATWSDRELWAPCFSTQVTCTTGSGDATIAGFLMGILRGMSPEETLQAACAVGACNVEAVDALSSIRSWPETAKRIAAGWHWDSTHEVWIGPMDTA